MFRSMSKKSKDIKKDPVLSSVFLNPGTGEVHKEGDTYKHPCLAATLQTLADQVCFSKEKKLRYIAECPNH